MAKKIRNNINEDVYFTKNDIVKVPRTTFFRNKDKKLTFNPGKLVPLLVDEILPGDTYAINMNSVVRFASPLIRPVMDDVLFEAWAFFVPSRLLDDNFESIIANYKKNPDYTTDVQETLSVLSIPDRGFSIHSVGDYFGLPTELPEQKTYIDKTYISLLPFRGYTLIWDYFFRDENLQNAITVENAGYQMVDGIREGDKDYDDFALSAVRGGMLCPLCRRHDVFSSALPAPMRGVMPTIGIGGKAPVFGTIDGTTGASDKIITYYSPESGDKTFTFTSQRRPMTGTDNVIDMLNLNFGNRSGSLLAVGGIGTPGDATFGWGTTAGEQFSESGYLHFNGAGIPVRGDISKNSYADLGSVTGISVNDLRSLIQIQRLKEQDARYGGRYPEYLSGSWGMVISNGRVQMPEFLGKLSFNLSVQQTVQSSSSTSESAQGNVSAYSLTGNRKYLFNKSFVEHGYLFILGGVRIKERTYSHNLNKMWTKKARLDFYNPVFANLGEQGIKNSEIFYTNDGTAAIKNDGVFGFQEAWYEYRYMPNEACGYMRPEVPESLAVWNYAENYTECPTLSPEWIKDDSAPINRTLAIPESVGAVFIADLYFENKATRPMPLHSIPGLMDHSGKIIV